LERTNVSATCAEPAEGRASEGDPPAKAGWEGDVEGSRGEEYVGERAAADERAADTGIETKTTTKMTSTDARMGPGA
jgi:hypothetical protein